MFSFYPALTGSKASLSKFSKTRKLGGSSTARKSPIGSTNNQWVEKLPLIKVSLYFSKLRRFVTLQKMLIAL
ncbi:hypothetical protein E0M25_05005 [Bacillus mycoides]|nr:hypothetical protein EXW58_14305 [Bacillus mycoides]QWG34115.1 hypothetical protein EXW30_14745 [Bacillus mycoides]QWI50091.1 hypothetical protein EXW56_14725 [Bacillus mycoides]TBX81557.1 hypothetical protein E0M25_05005 [Bacillus mycoides]